MKIEIKVSAMGESISEATVGEILKPTGSAVVVDDEILELETDKVNQVLYAPEAGVIELSVNTDDVVTIGQVIGYINSDGKAASEPRKEKKTEPPPPKEKQVPDPEKEGVRLTQQEFLEEIKKGPSRPVRPQPTSFPKAKRSETRTRMPRIRQVIASRLVEAKQQTAMLTTFNEVDMSAVMKLRTNYKDSFVDVHGVKLGYMSFFVKATLSALQAVPGLNSWIDGDEVVQRNYFDIGIAVGTEKGLVVPVVRDCDQLTFAQIEQQILEYASQAHTGTLSIDSLQGGSFTITNGGIYGSLLSTPILNPPQSGILGMHKIEKRAVVIDDLVTIRPMMYLALSYDHRIVDGKEAVTFLVHIKNCIEDPSRLLLEI